MPRFLVLLLYNLLYPPALLFMAPSALRKMKARGGKWSDFRQRLGFFDGATRKKIQALAAPRGRWWIHAVSVGEIGVASKLIHELLNRKFEERPGVVLSTTTPTGHAEARKLAANFPESVQVIYNPLDLWFGVRRCLNLIKPDRLVLVEAEVWPNLVAAACRRNIEVSLVNARLSPRSERRYQRVLPWVRPIFSMLSRVFVQEPADVARWEKLGVARDGIVHSGSIKYDTAGQREPLEQAARLGGMLREIGWSPDEPVLLAASTHAGEEAAIAAVFDRLRKSLVRLHLILVPRHAERAVEVLAELEASGFRVIRRSNLGLGQHASRITDDRSGIMGPDILLVDATGELRAWQHHATAVVMGKSFLGIGGQNPAEAIMAGKPVLFGPHMENFSSLVRQLLAAGGAVQVADFAELERKLADLLQQPGAAAQLAAVGAEALRVHEGATARTVSALLVE